MFKLRLKLLPPLPERKCWFICHPPSIPAESTKGRSASACADNKNLSTIRVHDVCVQIAETLGLYSRSPYGVSLWLEDFELLPPQPIHLLLNEGDIVIVKAKDKEQHLLDLQATNIIPLLEGSDKNAGHGPAHLQDQARAGPDISLPVATDAGDSGQPSSMQPDMHLTPASDQSRRQSLHSASVRSSAAAVPTLAGTYVSPRGRPGLSHKDAVQPTQQQHAPLLINGGEDRSAASQQHNLTHKRVKPNHPVSSLLVAESKNVGHAESTTPVRPERSALSFPGKRINLTPTQKRNLRKRRAKLLRRLSTEARLTTSSPAPPPHQELTASAITLPEVDNRPGGKGHTKAEAATDDTTNMVVKYRITKFEYGENSLASVNGQRVIPKYPIQIQYKQMLDNNKDSIAIPLQPSDDHHIDSDSNHSSISSSSK
ncbi:hypothetical protein EV182_005067, partial [Spiromyces aspiralis]